MNLTTVADLLNRCVVPGEWHEGFVLQEPDVFGRLVDASRTRNVSTYYSPAVVGLVAGVMTPAWHVVVYKRVKP